MTMRRLRLKVLFKRDIIMNKIFAIEHALLLKMFRLIGRFIAFILKVDVQPQIIDNPSDVHPEIAYDNMLAELINRATIAGQHLTGFFDEEEKEPFEWILVYEYKFRNTYYIGAISKFKYIVGVINTTAHELRHAWQERYRPDMINHSMAYHLQPHEEDARDFADKFMRWLFVSIGILIGLVVALIVSLII